MERASAAALAVIMIVSTAGALEAQSLRGSPRTMERQNRVAQQHDFTFLETAAQVRRFVNAGYLQPLHGNDDYELVRVSYPVARPEVRLFVERLAAQYRAACGEKLVVTSLTRPERKQPRNASDLSVHPAGMAVDLRISQTRSCRKWLEKTLLSLERTGVLDATRERRPPHYHVALFPQPYARYVTRIAGSAAVRLAEAPKAKSATAVAAADETDEQAQIVTANVEPAPAEEIETYRVHKGDSLWSIARRHGTTVDTLKDLNSLTSSRILAGQELAIPVRSTNGADDSL